MGKFFLMKLQAIPLEHLLKMESPKLCSVLEMTLTIGIREIDMFACPCCGYLTLSESPPGTFEICPVCNWEDDDVQYNNIDIEGGANKESLKEARQNFKEFGVSSLEFLKCVRHPLPHEIP